MKPRETFPRPRLPNTHYFLTLSRGERTRTYAVRTSILRLSLIAATVVGAGSIASTAFLAFGDNLRTAAAASETELRYAYEDRLAEMQSRIERMTSRHLLDKTTVEQKVRDLVAREARLEARTSLIQSFARDALPGKAAAVLASASKTETKPRRPGPNALQAIAAGLGETPSAPWPSEVSGFAAAESPVRLPAAPLDQAKPRPEEDTGAGQVVPGHVPALPFDTSALPVEDQLSVAQQHLDRTETAQRTALLSIGEQAHETVARFKAVLAQAGLSASRFGVEGGAAAEGGPFVPIPAALLSDPSGRDAADLQAQIREAARLKAVLASVPLGRPLQGPTAMTSGFGARVDPFNGHAAMHTGVDFGEPFGASVEATAPGRVTVAGPEGGYGNMVEIDHGNGLTTRYGHLSSILVEVGQRVEAGAVVGKVGATGRATGPHLHYETRIDGEAVDPVRFLKAGEKISAAE